MLKISMVLTGLLIISSFSFAQNVSGKWRSQGSLYSDKFLEVDIEYLIPSNSCSSDSLVRYRYNVIRIDRKHVGYYLNWRLDYFDCSYERHTMNNKLQIDKNTRLGVIDEGIGFTAIRLTNYFYDVKIASSILLRPVNNNIYNYSIEPQGISGKHQVNLGEESELNIIGGYLAPGATWNWYEGTVGENVFAQGSNIFIKPTQNVIYYVRGEKGNSKTKAISFTVKVSDTNIGADQIIGKESICTGETNIELKAVGGHLAKGAKWVWYKNSCGVDKIGEGQSITVSPQVSSQFFVRAEGANSVTECKSHSVSVSKLPVGGLLIIGPDIVSMGESFALSIPNAEKESGFIYSWYVDYNNSKYKVGQGRSIRINSLRTNSVYYVRAEAKCGESVYFSKSVVVRNVKPKILASRSKFFMNFGIVDNDPQQIKEISNVSLMMGSGRNIGWYLRGKLSIKGEKKSFDSYNSQITNYNIPGYYNYNRTQVNNRTSATGGLYLGGKHVALYFGGGYGKRDLLYGINQYQYSSSQIVNSFVRAEESSYEGYEVEGGLIFKAGPFNLIGGINSIEFKYIDCSVGIGFNL